MSGFGLAIALVKLLASVVSWLQEREWYQNGVRDADVKANAEQQARIAQAATARNSPDLYANSKLLDPRDRDTLH